MADNENRVKNRTFDGLFKYPVQFEIPFFQRGYAWEKKNWDQLFEDIKEQILDEVDEHFDFKEHEHFFGPIVVLERTTSDPALKKFLVIDGQQRITTSYLLIAAIRKHLKDKTELSEKAAEYYNQLGKYVINEVDDEGDDYRKIKVFSTKGDRLPTFLSIFNQNPNSKMLSTDLQLYIPGKNNIDAFNKYLKKKLANDYPDVPKLWSLAQAVLHSLKIVWIPLDEEKDDPQAIFESLNDKGMPLSAGELLCNYLFKPIIDSNKDHEKLHTDFWLSTQKVLETTSDFEDFLRYLFSIGQKKMIGKGRKVYVFFKNTHRKLMSEDAERYLKDIHDSSSLYNHIIKPIEYPHKNTKIKTLLSNIQDTRMESTTPYLLALLKETAQNSLGDTMTELLLSELLVLLVRRKMCELPTTKYDVFFPGLINKILVENPLVAFQQAIKDEGLWVNDEEFEDALINKPLYRPRDLAFSRLILREIDKKMQVYGQLPDYSTLQTIEHTLPQTLTAEWKNYLGSDSGHEKLTVYMNTLGNLSLLSRSANSHAGQDPFHAKIADYTDVSALTKDFKTRVANSVHWNIEAIKARSQNLAQHALTIWKWNL
jgi:uncharacterized protein with ParB-like and HNH nuclease domain